jgi:tyrosyl-tRNA synthetase
MVGFQLAYSFVILTVSMTLSEELTWRGLVNQTTFTDLKSIDGEPLTFYWGVDPSADSMTIGNLAAAMMVKNFIKHGHKPILLIGGATGLIGDPDGKSEERQLMDLDTINKNKAAITSQYKKIFEGHDFQLVDNYDWFKGMEYLDFLRDVGKHVPLRQMLGRDFVQSRLGDSGNGISYAEFSYVLIQAYDFLRLFEDKAVTLQVSGSDQWGNSIAGVDLIRRKTGKEAHVFSTPLVVDSTTGRKFGKSEGGAIWLDSKKTTPTQFYQFWINVDDQNLETYLKIFTELDRVGLEAILAEHTSDPGKRIGQSKLAHEVTHMIHGEQATLTAEKVTNILTGKMDIGSATDQDIEALRQEVSYIECKEDAEIAQVLVDGGLASSKTEARNLISNRAISINGVRNEEDKLKADDFKNGRLLIRRGKAFKDSVFVGLLGKGFV